MWSSERGLKWKSVLLEISTCDEISSLMMNYKAKMS